VEDRTDVLGRRIGAGIIDLLIVFVLFLVVGIAFGESETTDEGASVQLRGVSFVLFVVLTLLYYGGLEAMTGQTIGKRVFGVRVVRAADGGPAGPGQIAIRTVLRLIDGILLYLVAIVSIVATGQRRARLGDLAARTMVTRA
jgi:uncharacterized RDD family membrane protein YckC